MAVASRKIKRRRSRTRVRGSKPSSGNAPAQQEVQDQSKAKSHALRRTVFSMAKSRKKKGDESLSFGKAGDSFEMEADQMADRVLKSGDRAAPQGAQVRRTGGASCGECGMQMTADPSLGKVQRKEGMVQGKDGKLIPGEGFSKDLRHARKGGRSLPSSVKKNMEESMGADFSGVRIHTDQQSSQLNKSIGAKAFTHGNHIFFNQGQFDPSQASGRHLLAHELTHTLQQGAARAKSPAAPGKAKTGNKSMVQKADEDQNPNPPTTRQATITVTCNEVAGRHALLNPYTTEGPFRDSTRTFRVPLYEMRITGTTADGTEVTQTLPVVRYGVCLTRGEIGAPAFVCGLSDAQSYTAGYISPSKYRITGSWLLHPGSSNPERASVAGAGCIEVVDSQWSNLQTLLETLTGGSNGQEIAPNLTIALEACTPPALELVSQR